MKSTENSDALDKKLEAPNYLQKILKNKYFSKRKPKEKTVDFGEIIRKLTVYYTKTEILLMLIGSIAAIGNGTIMPLSALVFGELTAGFIQKEQEDFNGSISSSSTYDDSSFVDIIWSHCPMYLYASAVTFVLGFVQMTCWEWVNMNQIFRLRQVFFAQAMRQDVSWYDSLDDDCDLASRLVDDAERVKNGLGAKVPLFLYSLGFLVSGLAVGFSRSYALASIATAGGVILMAACAWHGKSVKDAALREQLRYGVAGGIASEVLSSLKVVFSFGNQKMEIKRFAKAIYEGKITTQKRYKVLSVCLFVAYGFTHAIYAAVLSCAGFLIENHTISPHTMFIVLMSVVSGTSSIGMSLSIMGDIVAAFSSCSTLFETIDSHPEADPYSKTGLVISDLKGNIEFKNVFFAYPTRPNAMVLCGLNLAVPEGKVAALVGSSGSGKSTVISMLLRFYDPLSGQVEIDGHNVKNMNVHGLRKNIGVVSQEPVLFDVTVEDNIRFGNPNATFEEIEEAAKKANAHQFIKSLVNGYQTVVGERGATLSGGQKQRIAIARALVRDPRVLLLDEATSALDAHSEVLVQAALENAMRGRTTVIVAHRLSTIRQADVIFVLKSGQVVEQGRHDELMANEGVYYRLVERQRIFHEGETANEHKILHNLTPPDAMQIRSSMRRASAVRFQAQTDDDFDKNIKEFTLLQMVSLGRPWLTIVGLAMSVFLGLNFPVFSLVYGELIEVSAYPLNQIVDGFSNIIVYLLILTAVSGATASIVVLAASHSTEDMIEGIRNQMFVTFLSQGMGFFDRERTSPLALTNSLSLNPPQIKAVAGFRVSVFLGSLISLFCALILSYVFFWPVAVFMSVLLPFVFYANYNQASISVVTYQKEDEATKKATKLASECFDNIKTVHFLCLQNYMVEKFCIRLKTEQKHEKKGIAVFALTYALSNCFPLISYGGSYWIGGVLIARNLGFSVKGLYTSISALNSAVSTIGTSSLYFQDFGRCKVAIAEALKVMNVPKELDPFCDSGLKPKIKGKIEFSDIYFAYPTRSQQILKGLNLTIEAGQTVALVGGSGCGKSTIIGLLERFYSPTNGSIFIDGAEIREINFNHLRNHMGLVTQEPMLFDKSIRENIAYGLAALGCDADDASIVRAATEANIHDFIKSLPQGYDTEVGERGSKLSGGQKQRIAIARALIRNPKILLLDEATSALDTESEKVVQDALDRASQGRTSIVIAHRLSTVRNADVIVVIQDGVVAEKGTHDELVRLKGKYHELLMHQ